MANWISQIMTVEVDMESPDSVSQFNEFKQLFQLPPKDSNWKFDFGAFITPPFNSTEAQSPIPLMLANAFIDEKVMNMNLHSFSNLGPPMLVNWIKPDVINVYGNYSPSTTIGDIVNELDINAQAFLARLVEGYNQQVKAQPDKLNQLIHPITLVNNIVQLLEEADRIQWNIDNYGSANKDDWCLLHWGTRTNATASQYMGESNNENYGDTFNTLDIYFETAWSTPDGFYYELGLRFNHLAFGINFIDEMEQFAGNISLVGGGWDDLWVTTDPTEIKEVRNAFFNPTEPQTT